MVKRCPRPFLWSSEAAYKINRGFDLNGQDVSMVWYLYTVVKYIRRMHFSFVEFAITVMRINASLFSTPPRGLRKLLDLSRYLLFYIIILFTEASM